MENKSIGGALVDVFDAAVGLAKSEMNGIARKAGAIAKAKGLGVVLLAASLVPLTLALIFLILFVFYALMRLGLGAWAAALIMGLVSLAVTGGLIFVGLKKLGGDVPDENKPPKLSDIQKDDLKYGTPKTDAPAISPSGIAPIRPSTSGTQGETSGASQSRSAASGVAGTSLGTSAAAGHADSGGHGDSSEHGGGHTTGGHPVQPAQVTRFAPSRDTTTTTTDATRDDGHTTAASMGMSRPQQHRNQNGDNLSHNPGPAASAQTTSTRGRPADERDPDRAEKVGIPVSTDPTYREDMKKEGY